MNKPKSNKKQKRENYFKQQEQKKKQSTKLKVKPDDELTEKEKLFRLDEEEKEHLKYLDTNYRDRAKERREGLLGDENSDEIDDFDEYNENEFINKAPIKGLNYDLLKKEMETVQMQEERENSLKQITEILKKNQLITGPKTSLGISLNKLLFNKEKENIIVKGKNNISSIYYEYDIHEIFADELPKIIIKKSNINNKINDPAIIPTIQEDLIKLIGRAMNLTRIENKQKKNIEENENVKEKEKKPELMPLSFVDDLNADDIFTSNAEINNEILKQEISTNPNISNVFDDLKKAFHKNENNDDEFKVIPITNKELQDSLKLANSEITLDNTNKLKRLRNNDDYDECYPEVDLPSLEELKKHRELKGITIEQAAEQSYLDKKHYLDKKSKIKKKQGQKELDKIQKLMKTGPVEE